MIYSFQEVGEPSVYLKHSNNIPTQYHFINGYLCKTSVDVCCLLVYFLFDFGFFFCKKKFE